MKRGFTLIELAAVIAIIAILAALTLPVIAQSKHRAGIATSISNLRQVGMAVHLYGSYAAEMFPHGIAAFYDDKRAWVHYDLREKARTAPILEEILLPYVRSREIYRAPGDPGPGESPSRFERYGSSYSFRLRAFLTPFSFSHYAEPSTTTMAHESFRYHDRDVLPLEAQHCVVYLDLSAGRLPWKILQVRLDP